ncbi:MAG: hypothetical protein M0011_07500 [Elusimicrobia bacterium]|nr:hypothetical protein [Elusimicrobiota bacterium]
MIIKGNTPTRNRSRVLGSPSFASARDPGSPLRPAGLAAPPFDS